MSEKENVLKELFWLGVEIIDNDYREAELTIAKIREYIKQWG